LGVIGNLLGWCFVYQIVCFIFYMWVRWTIPRFNDQLMHLVEEFDPVSTLISITGIVILRAEIATY
jgi:NADH:ubiquinone oxidoreductase subunit H